MHKPSEPILGGQKSGKSRWAEDWAQRSLGYAEASGMRIGWRMQPVNRARRMSKFASPLPGGAADGEALYRQGSLQASYFHAWFASNPQLAATLFLEAS